MRTQAFYKLAAMLVLAAISTSSSYGQNYEQPVYQSDGYMPPVTLSNTAYNDLIRRLEAVEGKVDEECEGGCNEVDALTKPTQKWSGRVHFDWWPFPNNDTPLANFLETGDATAGIPDFVGFRRLRFGVKGKVTETMEYKIEMEFADPEDLAFKDAYLGWNELSIFQTVLMGNQKRPYGLDHLNSSRYNVFMERPYVVEAYNQDARRLGLCAYSVSDNERWNWRYGVFLMDDLAKVGGQRTDNYQSEIAGRLANTIWYDETSGGRGYAHWAISGSAAFPGGGPDARFVTRPEARTGAKWFDTGDMDANSYQLLGLEGVLNIGSFSLVGELMGSQVQQRNGNSLTFGGGYVYAAYWLTGEHTPWSRFSGTLGRTKPLENFFCLRTCDCGHATGLGAWQIAARYSHGDFTDDAFLGGVGDSFTFGINWWYNPYGRMQFNYIHGNIAQRDPATTGGGALPVGVSTSGHYDLIGMRWMVDF